MSLLFVATPFSSDFMFLVEGKTSKFSRINFLGTTSNKKTLLSNLQRNTSCFLTPYSGHRIGLKLKVTKREEQDREFSGRHLGRQKPKIRLKIARYG